MQAGYVCNSVDEVIQCQLGVDECAGASGLDNMDNDQKLLLSLF